jgi:hypothetical protein
MDDQGTNRAGGGVRFRKLRIAFSAVCGIVCLLLIVLWVRSYSRWDYCVAQLPGPQFCGVGSELGVLAVGANPILVSTLKPWEWETHFGNKARYDKPTRGYYGFDYDAKPSAAKSISSLTGSSYLFLQQSPPVLGYARYAATSAFALC